MKKRLRQHQKKKKRKRLDGTYFPLHNRQTAIDAGYRARRTLDPFSYQPAPTRRQDRPSKPDGLTKQTYSTHVHVSDSEPPRKWHIVAYFSVHRPVLLVSARLFMVLHREKTTPVCQLLRTMNTFAASTSRREFTHPREET